MLYGRELYGPTLIDCRSEDFLLIFEKLFSFQLIDYRSEDFLLIFEKLFSFLEPTKLWEFATSSLSLHGKHK